MTAKDLQAFELLQNNQFNEIATSNNITGTLSKDILVGTASSESILGFGEDDTIVGKDGNDTLIGGAGNDNLASGRGNNLLLGNEGNDTLIASNYRPEEAGSNVFNGGSGDDFLVGNDGNDFLSGGTGNDIIFGFEGRDNISGGNGIDIINGGAGDDRILGEDDTDSLEGGDGNDLIFGGNGSDFIKGLEGLDTLNGGAGTDFFYLTPNTDRDLIVDFQKGQDVLILESTPRFGSPLTFEQLVITQGSNGTIIKLEETSETLAILENVAASSIDRNDFLESEELAGASATMDDVNIDMSKWLAQVPTHQTTWAVEETYRPNSSNIPQSIGSVTSQGVEVINADVARDRFNVDGSGITIGILSDSLDRSQLTNITAGDDVITGDLPGMDNPLGYNTPVSVLDDSADNSLNTLEDEGRALAQIVTDIAPGAKLVFRTAFKGANDFATGIDELVAAGADIIVDDIGSFIEPFFQDGVVAQAANRAVDAGVAYFSSAGNSDRDSYEAEFRPVNNNDNLPIPDLAGYRFHDFNPSEAVDISQNFTLQPGEGINLTLQWDEPFASAGGRGASSDLDVFVLDRNHNLVDFGAESNINKDAIERIVINNTTGATQEYRLFIGQNNLTGGNAPNIIKYIDFNGSISGAEYFTNSSTIFGQQNAEGVLAIGASSYQTPEQLELFSSVGTTPILFNEQGDRLSEPEIRQKPNLVAPNRVNTTFFIDGFDLENDGFPNFPGTSAASPHAAGVAALLLDAVPDATPQQIYGALSQTAIDLDNPYTSGFDTGLDTATGFGLIQADLALEFILT